ncbi:FMN-binding negative transcriptional regulator [Pseudoalteromonas fenneropenaei]|uniref:FMN-binding negative transcriptional regulator n=1 Tax=Pseudoalteromonas fenneropenaei TaxID=1737459 RepID=A0ABV7CG31_9GAMM
MSYPKRQFQVDDPLPLQQLIARFPLATVIYAAQEFCLLPLYLDVATGRLLGHCARYNPLTNQNGNTVRVIFHGESEYISPNLLPSQKLPTWHYQAVAITGTFEAVTDAEAAWHNMVAQTDYFEATQPTPWLAYSMSAQDQAMLMKQIQVFAIHIDDMQGNFKLSQHKSNEHREALFQVLTSRQTKDFYVGTDYYRATTTS